LGAAARALEVVPVGGPLQASANPPIRQDTSASTQEIAASAAELARAAEQLDRLVTPLQGHRLTGRRTAPRPDAARSRTV